MPFSAQYLPILYKVCLSSPFAVNPPFLDTTKHSPSKPFVSKFMEDIKPNPLSLSRFVDSPFIASERAVVSSNSNPASLKAHGIVIPLSIILISINRFVGYF